MGFARLPDMMVTPENPLSVFALKRVSDNARLQNGRLIEMVNVTRRAVTPQPRIWSPRPYIARPGRLDLTG